MKPYCWKQLMNCFELCNRTNVSSICICNLSVDDVNFPIDLQSDVWSISSLWAHFTQDKGWGKQEIEQLIRDRKGGSLKFEICRIYWMTFGLLLLPLLLLPNETELMSYIVSFVVVLCCSCSVVALSIVH